MDNRYCLGCSYCLRGLPQPRCPECGRTFDPDDPTTYGGSKTGVASALGIIAAHVAAWLTSLAAAVTIPVWSQIIPIADAAKAERLEWGYRLACGFMTASGPFAILLVFLLVWGGVEALVPSMVLSMIPGGLWVSVALRVARLRRLARRAHYLTGLAWCATAWPFYLWLVSAQGCC